ncbi:MAG TPA: class E sortase [Microbacteriaceae bacterium]|nr:class E sortase [Microbacteriaceae bacterium]
MPGRNAQEAPAPTSRRERARRRRRSAFLTAAIGVTGEVLLTAGVAVLLFIGWQLWLNDAIIAEQQTSLARDLGTSWQESAGPAPSATPSRTPTPTPTPEPTPVYGDPTVFASGVANAEVFAKLIVPRFGADYQRTIASGIGIDDVLNVLGVGHYPDTAMPGAVGNFALAAHRTAYGSSFEHIDQLDVGDSIYVETADGWYRYVFRNHEVVVPTAVEVLLPVPRVPGASDGERYITLTTCNPKHSTLERIIAYGVYDAWYPRAGGPPPEIAALVTGTA